jgi:hypothetical protein
MSSTKSFLGSENQFFRARMQNPQTQFIGQLRLSFAKLQKHIPLDQDPTKVHTLVRSFVQTYLGPLEASCAFNKLWRALPTMIFVRAFSQPARTCLRQACQQQTRWAPAFSQVSPTLASESEIKHLMHQPATKPKVRHSTTSDDLRRR